MYINIYIYSALDRLNKRSKTHIRKMELTTENPDSTLDLHITATKMGISERMDWTFCFTATF
jgi:hypothetical protein